MWLTKGLYQELQNTILLFCMCVLWLLIQYSWVDAFSAGIFLLLLLTHLGGLISLKYEHRI